MPRQNLRILGILALFVVTSILLLRHPTRKAQIPTIKPSWPSPPRKKPSPWKTALHPMSILLTEAQQRHEEMLARQSKSLAEAVQEYRRRYGMPPPPHFDYWYNFATSRNVALVDEYDTIHDSILPFWGLAPITIRARAREALGFDNVLLGVYIRNGSVVTASGGSEWQQKATVGMLAPFVQHLPDMDLAFNLHDEPRVVVPHSDLSRLVLGGKHAQGRTKQKSDSFTTANDINDGLHAYDSETTRFNRYAHQATWTESRLSCAPDSPGRCLEDCPDKESAESPLGFVKNKTAFSDVCQAPSLRTRFGFFDRPNAFDVVHDLFPIFSQSKISSFQDILYPSPWYWAGKVKYTDSEDRVWTEKADQMYWRGSTTGGFSRKGGWQRQHRQHMVKRFEQDEEGWALQLNDSEASVQALPRAQFDDLFNVHFSHIGQCDQEECQAQHAYFDVAKPAKQADAWNYKYLLDMDGNAFSGRFYAFLHSHSLVYKMAIFREWHEEWIRPWVHYIPLSLRGDDYVESVRYMAREADGHQQAQRVANEGRDWAQKALRNEDFEAWFFRLLLEYGRVVDDDRQHIGFVT